MIKKIHIIDYGLGNLFSVANAIRKIGHEAIIVDKPQEIFLADFLILPGVGAFQKGMNLLEAHGFKEEILNYVAQGRRLLGICLGMQMLFESSEENGYLKGLNVIPGHVKKINSNGSPIIKVPHIGWRKLISTRKVAFEPLVEGQYMYFAHSYYAETSLQYCIAMSNYSGIEITSVVNKENVWGTQFHPEKSGEQGLILMKKILDIC